MNDERWVVLGLAHSRAAWFSTLARWSTSAAVPIDFLKCISANETRARLRSGRMFSALLVGDDGSGLDRDLVAAARAVDVAVIVVDPRVDRDWAELGVADVLPADFGRDQILATLGNHASPVSRVPALETNEQHEVEAGWRGRLIAVTGPGGTGASVTAMAVAQAFAAEPSNTAMVLLADLALDAEQGMLHDARDIVPGVQELTDAHRAGRLPIDQVRDSTFDATERGYHLLLGLRRHRDWTALRPRAFAAALDGMLRAHRIVVADVDADIEGESLTGSLDVEDRNGMARTTLARADITVVVGAPSTKGVHALARTIRNLAEFGVPVEQTVPVLSRAPRSPRRRAEAVGAVAALLRREETAAALGNPVFLPDRPDVEDAIRDGVRLPAALARPLHRELARRLSQLAPVAVEHVTAAPVAVSPGSLSSWTEQVG